MFFFSKKLQLHQWSWSKERKLLYQKRPYYYSHNLSFMIHPRVLCFTDSDEKWITELAFHLLSSTCHCPCDRPVRYKEFFFILFIEQMFTCLDCNTAIAPLGYLRHVLMILIYPSLYDLNFLSPLFYNPVWIILGCRSEVQMMSPWPSWKATAHKWTAKMPLWS